MYHWTGVTLVCNVCVSVCACVRACGICEMCTPLECAYTVPYIIFTVKLYTCQHKCHLSPSPADGVSHLKEMDYSHLKKVDMSNCRNLSSSLIGTICCSSSLEELVVESAVSLICSSHNAMHTNCCLL